MILYRALENLLYNGKRIPKGALHSLEKLDERSISILIDRGRIAMYRAPPLDMLPGFKYRAKRLSRFGLDSTDLFSMSTADIEEKTGLTENLIAKWKRELNEVLGIKENVYKRDG